MPTKTLLSIALGSALLFAAGTGLAADIKERNVKFPIVNAIDHPQGMGAQKLVDVVSQKSGGKIKIKVFPNGTLGGEQQVAAAMQGGTVEISMMSPAQLVGTIKEFVVLDFPFSFANTAQADAVLDGPFGKRLMDYMPAKGWVGLGFMEQGYRSISNSKHAINKLEDIKGLKIRTILNPLYVDMLNTLGANAVPMPFPELYSAMETKTVDGQENPETTVDASKFYEVQKYFSATRHIYNPQMIMVGKKFWDTLSADEKKRLCSQTLWSGSRSEPDAEDTGSHGAYAPTYPGGRNAQAEHETNRYPAAATVAEPDEGRCRRDGRIGDSFGSDGAHRRSRHRRKVVSALPIRAHTSARSSEWSAALSLCRMSAVVQRLDRHAPLRTASA